MQIGRKAARMTKSEEIAAIIAEAKTARTMALQVGAKIKARDYERFKVKLLILNLEAGDYEKAIRRLSDALGM